MSDPRSAAGDEPPLLLGDPPIRLTAEGSDTRVRTADGRSYLFRALAPRDVAAWAERDLPRVDFDWRPARLADGRDLALSPTERGLLRQRVLLYWMYCLALQRSLRPGFLARLPPLLQPAPPRVGRRELAHPQTYEQVRWFLQERFGRNAPEVIALGGVLTRVGAREFERIKRYQERLADLM